MSRHQVFFCLAHIMLFLCLVISLASAGPIDFVRVQVVADRQPGIVAVGDGIPHAGEALDLALALINSGTQASGAVTATISAVDPLQAQTFVSATSFGSIAAGGEIKSVTPFRVLLGSNLADYTQVLFNLTVTEALVGQWSSQFSLQTLPSIRVCPAAGNGLGAAHFADDPQSNRIYCSNSFSGCVSVLDPQVGSTVATFLGGSSPVSSVVATTLRKVIVLDQDKRTIRVVSADSYKTRSSIQISFTPFRAAFDPVSSRCYISAASGTGRVEVLDVSREVLLTPLPAANLSKSPGALFVDSVKRKLYVVGSSPARVTVFNLDTGQSLAVPLATYVQTLWAKSADFDSTTGILYISGQKANGNFCIVRLKDGVYMDTVEFSSNGMTTQESLAFSPRHKRVFITGAAGPVKSKVIALAVGPSSVTPEAVLPYDGYQFHALYSERSDRVYFANSSKFRADILDASTLQPKRQIWLGNTSAGVTVDQTRNVIYATNMDTDSVSIIDGNLNRTIETFPVGKTPYDALALPSANKLLVNLYDESKVAVVDTLTRTVVSKTTLGTDKRPRLIRQNPTTGKIYVTNYWTSDVSVLSVTDYALLRTIPIGSFTRVFGLAINPTGNEIYVANSGGSEVAVLDGVSDQRSGSIPLGAGVYPQLLAYDSEQDRIFVSYLTGGTDWPKDVRVYKGKTFERSLALPEPTINLLADETNRILYVVGATIGKIYKVNLDTLELESSLDIGQRPPFLGVAPIAPMGLNAITGRLYVAPASAGALAVVRTQEAQPISAPTILSVTGDSQALIKWSVTGSTTGFHVYRSRSATGPFVRMTYAPLPPYEREYMDPRVVNGSQYYYKVAALGAGGREGLSSDVFPFVPADSGVADFSLSAIEAAVRIRQGESGRATLRVRGLNGFIGPVVAQPADVPIFVTVTIRPQRVFLPSALDLDATVSPGAAPGVYPMTIKATGNGLEKHLYLFLTVQEGTTSALAQTESSLASTLWEGARVILTTDAPSETALGKVTIKGRFVGVTGVSSCDISIKKPDGATDSVDNILVTDGKFGQDFDVDGEAQYGIWRAVVSWQGGADGLGQSSEELEVPVGVSTEGSSAQKRLASSANNQMVILGGAPGDPAPATSIDELAKKAYDTLLQRRYTSDSVAILSNSESLSGRDYPATTANLSQAVAGTVESGTLAMYLVGQVPNGAFVLNDSESLTPQQLGDLLNSRPAGQKQIVIMDAPNAGSFLSAVKASSRATVLSTQSGGPAHLEESWRTFSTYFFQQVAEEQTLLNSFNITRDILKAFSPTLPDQVPVNNFNPSSLGQLKIGSMFTSADLPEIQDVLPPVVTRISAFQTKQPKEKVSVFVEAEDESGIGKVSATVVKPDGSSESFSLAGQGQRFSAELGPYDVLGFYTLGIAVEDAKGNAAQPAATSFAVLAGDVNGDAVVDDKDLFALTEEWYRSNIDYNNSGVMDSGDLLLILQSAQLTH